MRFVRSMLFLAASRKRAGAQRDTSSACRAAHDIALVNCQRTRITECLRGKTRGLRREATRRSLPSILRPRSSPIAHSAPRISICARIAPLDHLPLGRNAQISHNSSLSITSHPLDHTPKHRIISTDHCQLSTPIDGRSPIDRFPSSIARTFSQSRRSIILPARLEKPQ
jgi:hypothetical protein